MSDRHYVSRADIELSASELRDEQIEALRSNLTAKFERCGSAKRAEILAEIGDPPALMSPDELERASELFESTPEAAS